MWQKPSTNQVKAKFLMAPSKIGWSEFEPIFAFAPLIFPLLDLLINCPANRTTEKAKLKLVVFNRNVNLNRKFNRDRIIIFYNETTEASMMNLCSIVLDHQTGPPDRERVKINFELNQRINQAPKAMVHEGQKWRKLGPPSLAGNR